jgi:hypothetical protein
MMGKSTPAGRGSESLPNGCEEGTGHPGEPTPEQQAMSLAGARPLACGAV